MFYAVLAVLSTFHYASSCRPSAPPSSHSKLDVDTRLRMDPKADPCDDFYQFACGSYGDTAKIPDDEGLMRDFMDVDLRMTEKIKSLMEESIHTNDPESTKMVKRYYRSCLNTESMEKAGVAPLKEIYQRLGGWPVVEGNNWNEKQYDWITSEANVYRELGIAPVFGVSINPDNKNSSKKLLTFDQPEQFFMRAEYLDPTYKTIFDAYEKLILATAVRLGANGSTTEAEAKDILKLEMALANIKTRYEDRRDYNSLYQKMTFSQLENALPKLRFDKWRDSTNSTGWNVQEKDEINVSDLPYFKLLDGVLKSFSSRTIANYQSWVVFWKLNKFLAPKLQEDYSKFWKIYSGSSDDTRPRWLQCKYNVLNLMAWPVGSMYVKRYPSDAAITEMQKMAAIFVKVDRTTLQTALWMDDATKMKALEKLQSMSQKIGYPDYIHDESFLMAGYSGAKIQEDTYLKNTVSIMKSLVNSDMGNLQKPYGRNDWYMPPLIVDAVYKWQRNELIIPSGFLVYPFFDVSSPNYVNFARIGFFLGHEMSHGYDDIGGQFDKDGNLVSWRTQETLNKFKDKAKCFVDQYGKIKDQQTQMNLNGPNMLGENIADNAGIKLAYKAYQTWKNETGKEERKIFGLEKYTIDQLFFLSYAQNFCALVRTEYLRQFINRDEHAPNDVRAYAPLQNYEEFARAYKCPLGSRMNPSEKCGVW